MMDTASASRVALDVSALPSTGFGRRSHGWWATFAFMIIEGTTLAVAAVTYLYLAKNFPTWPPPTVREPTLLVPTINMLLLLLAMAPMVVAHRAAHRFDLRRIRHAFLAALALSAVITVLRIWEFHALQVRWDANAYGSAAWALLGFHTALLVVDDIEMAAFTVLLYRGPVEKKHFGDAADAAMYQYFLSLVYIPIYLLLFLSPRLL